MSRQLNAEKIIDTLERLERRIYERFPDAGLCTVCADLLVTARHSAKRARAAGRPNIVLRFFVFLVIVAALAAQFFAIKYLQPAIISFEAQPIELTQALESAVNLFILSGAAIWFLISLEAREKRRFVLARLHELRSFAHVIDMHQLTKDPISHAGQGARTTSSPERDMTPFELARYLDYCTELLSITGKLAALYSEQNNDTEIVGAVNDIETLTSGIGRKVWQKIMIINRDEI